MSSSQAPGLVDRLVELGRTEGLACGLRAILAAGRPVPRSASGLALVPRDGTDAPVAPSSLAEAAGLRLARAQYADTFTDTDAYTDADTAVLLAAVRLGLTVRLLDLAVRHLAARRVEGAPLTDKQLMQGAIAEAVASLELCRRSLFTAATLAAAEALHARLADTGWSVVTLFGASGYLRDHAALEFYAAELVHDAWVAPIGAAA